MSLSGLAKGAATSAALEIIHRLPDVMHASEAGSLIEYTKTLRVEPVALVDQRVLHLPYMSDVMQSLSSIFAGYYLQAVSLSVNVGRVDVMKLLDRLNPNRDVRGNFFSAASEVADKVASKPDMQGYMVSQESYKYRLPRVSDVVSMEAGASDFLFPKGSDNQSARLGKDSINYVKEANNLSVGKLIEVEIESEGRKATFPVSIRIIVSGIDPDTLSHTLAIGSTTDRSLKERYHAWRAGQIGFFRDLVLCQDLIDEHRKTLMRDKSGFYSGMLKRRKNNNISAILSRSPSVAQSSNIYVLSEQTAKDLENRINGKLKDFRVRQKVFAETYGMLMVVIDPEWEQVTIYHRSIDTPTELSVKDLKSVNKGSGPNILEILQAYRLGQSPVI